MLEFQSIIVISHQPQRDIREHFNIDLDAALVDTEIYRPELSLGIDTIKDIQLSSRHRPLKLNIKTIIILEAHKMTLEAQNALLKLLEEPPSYLKLLLVCPHLQSFVDTLLSRCIIIRLTASELPTAPTNDVSASLTQLCSLPLPQRLSCLPAGIKSREQSLHFCQDLLMAAKAALLATGQPTALHNLEVLTACSDRLAKNTNPTLTLTDALLQLV